MAILTWLGVPGDQAAWQALGFETSADMVQVGSVLLEPGIEPAAWGFDEMHGHVAALGIETVRKAATNARVIQPNGIDRVDHVVYAVPELDPAVDALTEVLGAPPRKRARPRGASGPEMAFFRVGEGFIEVVASGQPPSLWGVAFSAPDLDATVAAIRSAGGPVGDAKPAVQGGRIASVWKGHVGWGIAIMEPPRTTG